MKYRKLGNTGLTVSEIGLGAEWLEKRDRSEVEAVISCCEENGINILDCWMSEPQVRSNIGYAISKNRSHWIVQGHLGSTWQNGQYVRTRDINQAAEAFQDLLDRLQTDYIDLGRIHFVDQEEEFHNIMEGDFYAYAAGLKERGIIRHIGMSTHSPEIAKLAALSGKIEMILFSVNPAFDMLPATAGITDYFQNNYTDNLSGIDPERARLYQLCEEHGVGITVMKGFAGGRLLSAASSPFGVALTPVQCIHYALTRPAVSSILAGYSSVDQVMDALAYETASDKEKDYASILANAPAHAYYGQCTYCGHCAPCPQKIDIAMVNKFYDLAILHGEPPATLREHYRELPANGDDCIACKACEKRCPFGVPIAERMEKARLLFSKAE